MYFGLVFIVLMFDIYLFPLTPLLLGIAYPIFIRYAFIPVVFFAKVKSLVELSLYNEALYTRSSRMMNTDKANDVLFSFILWFCGIVRFLTKNRNIVNFFTFFSPDILWQMLSKNFCYSFKRDRIGWTPYTPRNSTFSVVF